MNPMICQPVEIDDDKYPKDKRSKPIEWPKVLEVPRSIEFDLDGKFTGSERGRSNDDLIAEERSLNLSAELLELHKKIWPH